MNGSNGNNRNHRNGLVRVYKAGKLVRIEHGKGTIHAVVDAINGVVQVIN